MLYFNRKYVDADNGKPFVRMGHKAIPMLYFVEIGTPTKASEQGPELKRHG